MRSLLSALLSLSLVLLPAGAARADADDDAKARDFYQKGMARFQLEEYDGAIALWQDGFRLKPAPEFLYNIAQAYRLSHRSEKAIGFYKKYLTMAPKAANRGEVEKQITALQRVLGEQQKVANAPPTSSVAPGGRGTPPPEEPAPAPAKVEPAPTPPPVVATPAPSALTVSATAPEHKPLVKKPWFWAVVGGAAVAVGLGVGLGVGLTASPSTPDPNFGTVRGN